MFFKKVHQTCPRRMREYGPWDHKEEEDRWDKTGPDRVCSFCGSMHPEDFEAFLDRVLEDPDVNVRLDISDKSYKVYLRRPEIMNASQGAIKYYKQHTSQLDTADKQRLQEKFTQAVRVSIEKFNQWFESLQGH